VSHALASANVFLGELMMDPGGVVASGATPAAAGVETVIDPKTKPNPEGLQPVGDLPYGAAISIGGIVVAAMLLMRG
jgi:hypothetical protein